jgi:trans-aconitate methyltransferase
MQRVIFRPIQRTVLQMAAEQVGRPGAVLDVGCGTGKLLKSAEARFPDAKLVVVEAAIEMAKYAQTLNPAGTIQFRASDGRRAAVPGRSL